MWLRRPAGRAAAALVREQAAVRSSVRAQAAGSCTLPTLKSPPPHTRGSQVGFSYPVVPKGKARIRVQLSAAHEDDQIDRAVAAFVEVGRELGVIKA